MPGPPSGVGSTTSGLEVEDLAEPVDARGRLLEDVGQVGQPRHRPEDHPGQGRRRDHPAGRHPALEHFQRPDREHQCRAHAADQDAEIGERRAPAGSPAPEARAQSSSWPANSTISSGSAAQTLITIVPSSLAFRLPKIRSIFSRMIVLVCADPPHEVAEVQREQRGDHQDHGRQPPVAREQQRGDGQRRAQVGQDREGLAGHEHLDRADVVHHPRDDRAAGGLVEIGQAELLEPLVHAGAAGRGRPPGRSGR